MRRIVGLVVAVSLGLANWTLAGGSKGTVVELDGLKSTAPAEWVGDAPMNKFRLYQFGLPKAKGDEKEKSGEVVVFFFGKGSGGSMDENLKRWKGMFRAPEGKKIDDISSVEKFNVGKVPVAYLDVKGTYVFKFPPFDPNAKEQRLSNYRMLSVYFDSDNGPYFIRMTGPAKSVEEQKPKFDQWLKNFK